MLGACQALDADPRPWASGVSNPRCPDDLPRGSPGRQRPARPPGAWPATLSPPSQGWGGGAGFVSFQRTWAAGLLGRGLRAATEVCQQEWKNTASWHRAPARDPLVAAGRAAPTGIPRVTGRLRGWRSGAGPQQILQNKGVLPERLPRRREQVGCAALGVGRKRAHTYTHRDTQSDTDVHTDTHSDTDIHTDTHRHTLRHRHTYRHTRTRQPAWPKCLLCRRLALGP